MSFWNTEKETTEEDEEYQRTLRSNSSELQELRDKITELRRFVLSKLEESLQDNKELKTMWKMRIKRLEERELPATETKRKLLGSKVDST